MRHLLIFGLLWAGASFLWSDSGTFYAHIPNLQEKEKEIALSAESVKAVLLHSTTAQSVHLVQIRTKERRHIHQEHDLTAIVRSGRGTIVLGNLHRKVRAGDVIVIPRGVIHQMINEGKAPALAVVIFSPPFDGKDVVSVEIDKGLSLPQPGNR